MEFHNFAGLLGPAWRERSTRIGAGLVVVAAVVASFLFSGDQLAEYAGRWAILGPAVLAVLGFLGIAKKDSGSAAP